MKKLVVLCTVIYGLTACNAPSTGNGASVDLTETNKRLYERAVKMGDDRTAMVALNYLLLNDTNNYEYTDSLARIYLTTGNLNAGIDLGLKVMDKYPDNHKLLELVAVAQGYNRDYIKSYKNFKKLHEEVGDVTYLFMMAQVLVEQQNYNGAIEKLDLVIADTATGRFDAPTSSGGMQEVDIKAGAYFFKAQYAFSQNKQQQGVDFLRKALDIDPTYEAAIVMAQNLESMAQQQAAYNQQMQRQSAQQSAAKTEAQKYEEWKRKNGQ